MMFKIISFDVDGTLVDTAYVEKIWLEAIPLLYAQIHDVDVDTARHRVLKAYDTVGDMDLRWYELSYWFDRFDLPGSHETILDSYSHAIHIYDDVVPVLEELEESYRLIVISNAHRDFLNRTLQSISHYFDHVFSATSDYEQVGKSHHFYRRICQALGVSPREMAHVGDHFEFDYETPRGVGIQAFFLDRDRVHHQDGLQNLIEFKEKIKDLENHGG